MQQTNQLTHKMDGEEAHKHPLRNKCNKLNSRVRHFSLTTPVGDGILAASKVGLMAGSESPREDKINPWFL